MQTPTKPSAAATARAVLELATSDPMAAMRHVAACLARRSHDLLGLLCLPGQGGEGRLMVALADDGRLDRLLVELAGLPEVRGARRGTEDYPDFKGLFQEGLAA